MRVKVPVRCSCGYKTEFPLTCCKEDRCPRCHMVHRAKSHPWWLYLADKSQRARRQNKPITWEEV